MSSALIINKIYPVGFIIFTASSENPSISIGGTWERYAQGKCLFSVDDNDTDFSLENTGGSKSHTLTIDEMPSHTHSFTDNWYGFRGAWVGFPSQGGNQLERYYESQSDVTAATGGSQAHPIMPPYVAIYCWKRIA